MHSAAPKAFKTISLYNRYIAETYYKLEPYIALALWLALYYVCDMIGAYEFSAQNTVQLLGPAVAVAAIIMAERQLQSWKQEKLLERLASLHKICASVSELCLSIEVGPLASGKYKKQDFSDSDILYGARLIKYGIFKTDIVICSLTEIKNEVKLIRKLSTNRSFLKISKKDIDNFCDCTTRYINDLMYCLK
ncbi:hypothetical protein, partial [Pseudomonas amygdali]